MAITRADVLGHWPFENTLLDYAQNNTTTSSNVSFISDTSLYGIGALDFTSTTASEVATGLTLPTSAFTVCAWVKLDATTPSMGIFTTVNNDGDRDGFVLSHNASVGWDAIIFSNNSATARIYEGSVSASTDTWYFVCATYDGTTLTLRVNGSDIGTSPDSTGSMTTQDITGEWGVYYGDTASLRMNGKIKGGWVFNRALTTTEQDDLYNSGAGKAWTEYFGLDDDLAHYYSFDSNANDEVGSNNGTVVNAVNTTGYLSNAYDFDGVGDWITFSDWFADTTTPRTISCWYRHDTIAGDQTVWINRHTTGGLMTLRKTSAGAMDFLVWNGSTYTTINVHTPVVDTWYHVVCVWDGTTGYAYLNGTLANSSATALAGVGTATGTRIAAATNNDNEFFGLIDEFGVWDRALTAGEVKRLYNYGCARTLAEIQGSESPLLEGLWDYISFDGDATTSRGRMGNGTAGGDATTTSGGKINQAAMFDGTGDWFDFSGPPDSDSFSVQAWWNSDVLDNGDIIFTNDDGTGGNREYYLQYLSSGTTVIFNVRNSANTTWYGGSFGTYSTGTWYHTICVRDSISPEVRAFGNATKYSLNTSSFTRGTTNNELKIGIQWNDSSNPYDGLIDEVAVWARDVVQSDATALYNSGDGFAYPFEAATPPVSTANSMFFGGGF